MNEITRISPVNEITRISPVTDNEAARLVRPQTLADLASEITATPVETSPDGSRPTGQRARRSPRRRALLAIPLVAVLSAVAAFAAVTSNFGSAPPAASVRPSGQVQPTPQTAQALAFTTGPGGSLTVIIRDPLADPSVYRAEFARRHLDITLKMRPVSPSLVGSVFYLDEPGTGSHLVPITAKGACDTPGGGDKCPVGVKIPAGFRGPAEIDFGRAARPGEQYVSTGSAFAPGEAMHGMTITGKTVAEVAGQLHARHVSVALFNEQGKNGNVNVHSAPGGWYVYDADPWAPGEVMLFVGPTPHQLTSPPAAGTPVASPTS
jgi:hypothetical protein